VRLPPQRADETGAIIMFENPAVLFGAALAPTRMADYRGPERRTGAPPPVARWLAQMLDEIDYGMLLLGDDAELVHVNHAARTELDAGHPLQLLGRQLRARHAHDVARLHDALAGASQRGLRKLVALGDGAQRVNVAVIPLGSNATLVVMNKRRLSERISVQAYARMHALTPAETRVLESLCEGLDPREIAELNEVGLATVRTQIGSIRAKTGADNIRALVRQVAVLPPMVSALRA
jgi:DNA-binding CsgD family transcriptional regulator